MNHDCQITQDAEAVLQKALRDLFQHGRQGRDDASIRRGAEIMHQHQVNEVISTWAIFALMAAPFFAGIVFDLAGRDIVGMMVIFPILTAFVLNRVGVFDGRVQLLPQSVDRIALESSEFFDYQPLNRDEIEELARLAIQHDPAAAVLDTWRKDGMPLRKRDAMALRRFANAHEKYRSRLDLAENFRAAAARGRVAYATHFR